VFILCKSETMLGTLFYLFFFLVFSSEQAALEAKIEKRFSLASTLQQETLDVSSSFGVVSAIFSYFFVSYFSFV